MGQSQVFKPIDSTPEKVDAAIKTIFDDLENPLSLKQTHTAAATIVEDLTKNLPYDRQNQKLKISQTILKIYFRPARAFEAQLLQILNLFCQKMESIMKSKALVMVSREDWKISLDLAAFLILATDQRTMQILQTADVRSDIHEQSKQFIKKYQQTSGQWQSPGSVVNKINLTDCERIQKCLRISMSTMINMRTYVFSRSSFTFKIISLLEMCCFIMYLKAFYSNEHHSNFIKKARSEHLKKNIQIGSYFLAAGVSLKIPAIYESAVIFLSSLLQDIETLPPYIQSYPSHFFKNLPIVSSNNIYDYLLVYLFYNLVYIKQKNGQVFIRFSCNRIMSLKLAIIIMNLVPIRSDQIKFYLQQLCLQVKPGQIQRAFLSQLSNIFFKDFQQQTYKKFSLQKKQQKSQILGKFKQTHKQIYCLNFSNKKYKISPQQIITELQNDENTFQREFKLYCEKFVYQIVLKKQVLCIFEDVQLWNEILPNLNQYQNDDSNEEKVQKQQKQQEQKPKMIKEKVEQNSQ